jgi:hypothetical protein
MTGLMELTKSSFTSNFLRRNMGSPLSIPSVVLLLGATDIVVVRVCTFELYFQNVIPEASSTFCFMFGLFYQASYCLGVYPELVINVVV